MKKTSTRVKVAVTVEITLNSSWSEEHKMGQVYEDSADGAVRLITKALTERHPTLPICILGTRVEAVTTREA